MSFLKLKSEGSWTWSFLWGKFYNYNSISLIDTGLFELYIFFFSELCYCVF